MGGTKLRLFDNFRKILAEKKPKECCSNKFANDQVQNSEATGLSSSVRYNWNDLLVKR